MRLADPRRIAAVLLVVALAALGAVLPVYWVYLLSAVAVGAIIARSVGLLTGRLGVIVLCQMSFAAIGGWTVSAAALARPEIPFPLLVLAGGLVAAPVGLALGIATARIRGIELAVVTLGFAAALDLVLRQGSFPGVGEGRPVVPSAPFGDPRGFFALCWIALIALQIGLAALDRTVYGLGWAAARSSERAAAALGVRVGAAKAGAFAVGALLAGVAGGLLAGQYGLLTPAVFSPLVSMTQLATAVLCGAGLFGGAVLSGLLSAFVPEVLRRLGLPLDLGSALLALGAFDVLRRGGGGIAEQLNARLEERAFRGVRT
ncbi:MAG: branched-chain amino acid ABC transporter permease, partial [Leucobacter sp.]